MRPAMPSEVEDHAKRLANECARTLLAYYQAEHLAEGALTYDPTDEIEASWSDHQAAVYRYKNMFPELGDWERLVDPAEMRKIEENRP